MILEESSLELESKLLSILSQDVTNHLDLEEGKPKDMTSKKFKKYTKREMKSQKVEK